jgi:hypothetical protein
MAGDKVQHPKGGGDPGDHVTGKALFEASIKPGDKVTPKVAEVVPPGIAKRVDEIQSTRVAGLIDDHVKRVPEGYAPVLADAANLFASKSKYPEATKNLNAYAAAMTKVG